jgi:two-component system response regulator RegA
MSPPLAAATWTAPAERAARSVLLIDDSESYGSCLASAIRKWGATVHLEKDLRQARASMEEVRPDVVVTELRVGVEWAFDFLPALKAGDEKRRVVVATYYPSVATAVRAVRLGADDYFVKPVAPHLIVHGGEPGEPDPVGSGHWPTLNRTIWEHLNQVYVASGSMASAARRLGLDRRSLRRMLAKFPPPR